MFTWLKNLLAKPHAGSDWIAHRTELARDHLAKERARKIKELGANWVGHPSRRINRVGSK